MKQRTVWNVTLKPIVVSVRSHSSLVSFFIYERYREKDPGESESNRDMSNQLFGVSSIFESVTLGSTFECSNI